MQKFRSPQKNLTHAENFDPGKKKLTHAKLYLTHVTHVKIMTYVKNILTHVKIWPRNLHTHGPIQPTHPRNSRYHATHAI